MRCQAGRSLCLVLYVSFLSDCRGGFRKATKQSGNRVEKEEATERRSAQNGDLFGDSEREARSEGGCDLASDFFVARKQESDGILCVFRAFALKRNGKSAVKARSNEL